MKKQKNTSYQWSPEPLYFAFIVQQILSEFWDILFTVRDNLKLKKGFY